MLHTLLYADCYLGENVDAFRNERFHKENAAFFGDYEQLQDREPVEVYERDDMRKYMRYVRHRATDVIASESAESLSAPAQFYRRDISRAELYIYNIRHIQHHAANLGLRLRIDVAEDIPWIGSGWRDT